ncbi:MAG: HPF/RaiA family ribosome-associated protein, partial [Gammaproteobacteria bacterium]
MLVVDHCSTSQYSNYIPIIFDYFPDSITVTLSIVSKGNIGSEVAVQIEIQARNFYMTQAMRVHIERQLGFALNTCRRHIKRILVRLSDINGPRGGNDKRCHLEVILPGQAAVVVKDTEDDLYLAINRAASRASRTVMRRLRRRR